ncbi:MAG: hypothetical protein FWH07_08480 [Oscillospiraceae bacterium]|nr:hypothetical protein [Oscillospiraceae bacterium]
MIIKKIINGVALGYNTEKRSYCELPEELRAEAEGEEGSEKTLEELRAEAEDLGFKPHANAKAETIQKMIDGKKAELSGQ